MMRKLLLCAVAVASLLVCVHSSITTKQQQDDNGAPAAISVSFARQPHQIQASSSNTHHHGGLKTLIKPRQQQQQQQAQAAAALSGIAARRRAGTSIPIQGGLLNLGYYYTSVSVGTPSQSFTLLLDTGSSNLVIASNQCDSSCSTSSAYYDVSSSSSAEPVALDSEACRVCNPAGLGAPCLFGAPFAAPTNQSLCGYGISYGGGTSFVTGFVANDTVTWAGFTVSAGIVAMTAQIPANGLSSPPVNGIIGFANENNAVAPTWIPTILGQIVSSSGLNNLFGLCLDPANGGVMDIGATVAARYSGNLQWVPMTEHRWYNMNLKDVRVNNASLGVFPVGYNWNNDQIGAFVDSGTSALLLAPAAFSSLQSVFQSSYCSLPSVCSQANIFTGTCISDAAMKGFLDQFPTLYFTFQGENGDVVLSTPPSSYFIHAGGQYCFSIAGVPGIGAVLGDVFMENYYIVHDRANWRLGFAPVASCSA